LEHFPRCDVPRLVRGIAKVEIDAAVRPIYENVHEIAKIPSRLLVKQGTENDVVPIAQGAKYFLLLQQSRKHSWTFQECIITTSELGILQQGCSGEVSAADGSRRRPLSQIR
jgi:hypothetical protein